MRRTLLLTAGLSSFSTVFSQVVTLSVPFCPAPTSTGIGDGGGGTGSGSGGDGGIGSGGGGGTNGGNSSGGTGDGSGGPTSNTPGVLSTLETSSGETYVFDGFYPTSPAREIARRQAGSFLGGSELISSNMTLELCANFCDEDVSAYFAVTDGDTCSCGDSQPSGTPIYEVQITLPCPGNPAETCSSPGYGIVYKSPTRAAGTMTMLMTSTDPSGQVTIMTSISISSPSPVEVTTTDGSGSTYVSIPTALSVTTPLSSGIPAMSSSGSGGLMTPNSGGAMTPSSGGAMTPSSGGAMTPSSGGAMSSSSQAGMSSSRSTSRSSSMGAAMTSSREAAMSSSMSSSSQAGMSSTSESAMSSSTERPITSISSPGASTSADPPFPIPNSSSTGSEGASFTATSSADASPPLLSVITSEPPPEATSVGEAEPSSADATPPLSVMTSEPPPEATSLGEIEPSAESTSSPEGVFSSTPTIPEESSFTVDPTQGPTGDSTPISSETRSYTPIPTEAICPKDDFTLESDPLGIQYNINCDRGFDGTRIQPLHADNFDSCLQACDMFAGCTAVTYVDGATSLDANCVPYSSVAGFYTQPELSSTFFAAIAVNGSNEAADFQDDLCNDPLYGDSSNYYDVYGMQYLLGCGYTFTGTTNLVGMRANTLEACVSYCSLYLTCKGVVFTPPGTNINCQPVSAYENDQLDASSQYAALVESDDPGRFGGVPSNPEAGIPVGPPGGGVEGGEGLVPPARGG